MAARWRVVAHVWRRSLSSLPMARRAEFGHPQAHCPAASSSLLSCGMVAQRRAPTFERGLRRQCRSANSAAAATSAPDGADSSDVGRWSAFCSEWNEILLRRPVPMVVFFGAVGTVTWGSIFAAMSVTGFFPSMPECAVGWLVMRLTMRLRMPLNLAIAAPLAAAAPSLSWLKISPLLTAFAADKESKEALQRGREHLETHPSLGEQGQKIVKGSFSGLVRFGKWAEGPIDKYGLSYYIASKITSFSTLTGATAAAMVGLDVPSAMAAWGFSGELQSDAGLFAAAAATNVLFTPLHFYGAVRVVSGLENFASRAWEGNAAELQSLSNYHAERAKAAGMKPYQTSDPAGSGERKLHSSATGAAEDQAEEEHEPLTRKDVVQNLMNNATLLVLLFDFAFMLWVMRRMARSSQSASLDEATSSNDAVTTAPECALEASSDEVTSSNEAAMTTAEGALEAIAIITAECFSAGDGPADPSLEKQPAL